MWGISVGVVVDIPTWLAIIAGCGAVAGAVAYGLKDFKTQRWDDLKDELDLLRAKVDRLETELANERKENAELRGEVAALRSRPDLSTLEVTVRAIADKLEVTHGQVS